MDSRTQYFNIGEGDTAEHFYIGEERVIKPRDPEYFKQYYQNKLKGVKYHCEICSKDIAKDKKARHARSKAHMRKFDEQPKIRNLI